LYTVDELKFTVEYPGRSFKAGTFLTGNLGYAAAFGQVAI
jgi:hypothetical protein